MPRSAVLAPFAAIALALTVATCRDAGFLSPREESQAPPSFLSLPVSVTLVGAGNIASCSTTGDEATATLLDAIPGTVMALGDNAYTSGTLTQYNTCYGPSWGRRKADTKPAVGDLDYKTTNASGYFGYFGAAAGDPKKGYYSYDLGAWHVIVLNSNTSKVSTAAGSAQEQWLRADLAAHAARGHADVQAEGVGRDGLQQVEDVQVQDRLGPFVGTVQLDVEAVPEAVPGSLVAGQQLLEVLGARHQQPRVGTALGSCPVPGGGEGDDLLDGRRASLPQLEGELVGDEPGLGDQPPVGLDGQLVAQQPGAGRQRDPHVRLGRLDLQVDRLGVHLGLAEHRQMATVQVAVALDPRVDHPAVQPGANLQRPRPVLGREGGLQPGEMLVLHAHEAALHHAGPPALVVPPRQVPDERPMAQVQLEAVLQDVGLPDVEPRPAGDPQLQHQPVGDVDQVLVLDPAAGDLGDQPVVEAGQVGAGVVDPVGAGLRQRSAGHEVAVAQRAQRLAQPLPGGVEAVVDQRPDARRALGVPPPELPGGSPLSQAAIGQSSEGDVVQGGHDQVGARPGQQLLVAEAGHSERGHVPGLGRLDPAGGVLDHEAGARANAQLRGRGEEDHRVRLAAREVPAGGVGVEQLLQRHPGADEVVVQPLLGGEGVQADPLEEELGVLGRGGRRHPNSHRLDGQDEP